MAALTAVTPTNSGTVTAPVNVSASDTIAQAQLGSLGAYLYINNGNASSDTVTISDAGLTPAGNPLASGSISDVVANGTAQIYVIRPSQVNPSTGLVTITHTTTATVTCQVWPIGSGV